MPGARFVRCYRVDTFPVQPRKIPTKNLHSMTKIAPGVEQRDVIVNVPICAVCASGPL